MFDLITNLPALIGGAVALIVAVLGYGKVKERKGRRAGAQDVRDELADAYDTQAEELRDAKNDLPIDDDDVLAELHKRSK